MRSGAAAGDSRFAFASGGRGRASTDSRVITAAAVAAPAAKAKNSASSYGNAPSASTTLSVAGTATEARRRGGRQRGDRSHATRVPHTCRAGGCTPAAGHARAAGAVGSLPGGRTTARVHLGLLPVAHRAPNTRDAANSAAGCGGLPRHGGRQTLCSDAAAIVAGGSSARRCQDGGDTGCSSWCRCRRTGCDTQLGRGGDGEARPARGTSAHEALARDPDRDDVARVHFARSPSRAVPASGAASCVAGA